MGRTAVIEDWDEFIAFLSAQPLCQWSIKKQREVSSGMHHDNKGRSIMHTPPKVQSENAELAAALSSMA